MTQVKVATPSVNRVHPDVDNCVTAKTCYKVRSPSGCFIGWVDAWTYAKLPHDWELLDVWTAPQHDELPF